MLIIEINQKEDDHRKTILLKHTCKTNKLLTCTRNILNKNYLLLKFTQPKKYPLKKLIRHSYLREIKMSYYPDLNFQRIYNITRT